MKALKEYLIEIKPLIGSDDPSDRAKFEEIFLVVKENFSSTEDQKLISDFIDRGIAELTNDIGELTIKAQLAEVSEIVSLSYIAKKYFNKSRSWIYQRINGNTVHNKPVRFTDTELLTLQSALKDISNRLNSITLSNA